METSLYCNLVNKVYNFCTKLKLNIDIFKSLSLFKIYREYREERLIIMEAFRLQNSNILTSSHRRVLKRHSNMSANWR